MIERVGSVAVEGGGLQAAHPTNYAAFLQITVDCLRGEHLTSFKVRLARRAVGYLVHQPVVVAERLDF